MRHSLLCKFQSKTIKKVQISLEKKIFLATEFELKTLQLMSSRLDITFLDRSICPSWLPKLWGTLKPPAKSPSACTSNRIGAHVFTYSLALPGSPEIFIFFTGFRDSNGGSFRKQKQPRRRERGLRPRGRRRRHDFGRPEKPQRPQALDHRRKPL